MAEHHKNSLIKYYYEMRPGQGDDNYMSNNERIKKTITKFEIR